MMKRSSRKWIFLILLLGVGLACFFYARTIFDRAVLKTVSLAVNAINIKKEQFISIDDVDVNVTKGSVFIKGIRVMPDSLYYEKFENGEIATKMLADIQIGEIELAGLNVKSILWHGRIDSATISIKNVITNIYLGDHKEDPNSVPEKNHTSILDSLYLKGLKSINVGEIQVNNYQLNVIDAHTNDTISSFSGDNLELTGVDFEKRQDGVDLFQLQTEKLELKLEKQRLKLAKDEYEINLGALEFKNSDQILKLVDISYSPTKSLEHLASQKKYSTDLFDVHFKNLTVYGLDIRGFTENHLVSVKKISVDGLDLKMLRDKQRPDDIHKKPLLPHQALEKLKYPIHIGEFAIENSVLSYKEIQPKNANDFFVVNLTYLNAHVNYITSIKDSLASGKPLTIALNAKLLDKAKMDINVTMPYNHRDNAFHYIGNIGAADLTIFSQLLLPTAHIAIERGKLEGIHFSVNATPTEANGALTMRYSDLHVDIPEKHKTVEHALSFLANSAIHKFNPKKNGELRVAEIHFVRVPYKGLGGYINKSILSGIINAIEPFGKIKEHISAKDQGKTKKEIRAERKVEKKKRKEDRKTEAL